MLHSEDQRISLTDVLKAEVQADLYTFYDHLRETAPLYWDTPPGYPVGWWVITRYADVMAVLGDRRYSAQRFSDLERVPRRVRPVASVLSRVILYSDPPAHTRLRTLMTKAFAPRMIESLRPRIQQLVNECLDAVHGQDEIDMLPALAAPLPIHVIAELLGVSPEDRWTFKGWGDDLSVVFGNARWSAGQTQKATQALEGLTAYLRNVAARRRVEPRDDLFQSLVMAEEQQDSLTEEELYANCVLILMAGHQTTTNLIGNGLVALLQNQDQLQALRDDPSLFSTAIPELLRYDSPAQVAQRIAAEDLDLGGQHITAGQQLLLVLGAANRDPTQFAQPHQLDLTRPDNRHMAFGHGIHFCLGAALARLEGEIALRTILERFPIMRLATSALEWERNMSLRALKAVPIAVTHQIVAATAATSFSVPEP